MLDQAVSNVWDALLDMDDASRRDTMTRFVLSSSMAADRGFGGA
jgi:hypothetical protein